MIKRKSIKAASDCQQSIFCQEAGKALKEQFLELSLLCALRKHLKKTIEAAQKKSTIF